MSLIFEKERASLSELAPAGFYIALRIRFMAPEAEMNHLPTSLVSRYGMKGMVLNDPMMRWAFRSCGKRRWSSLLDRDPAGVMAEYTLHGLRYGCVTSALSSNGEHTRSIGIFGRSDREYTEHEMARIEWLLLRMHRTTPPRLTASQIEALQLLAEGHRYRRIAHILGITESAVKARFKSIVTRTGARTPVQALQIALNAGLLSQSVMDRAARSTAGISGR